VKSFTLISKFCTKILRYIRRIWSLPSGFHWQYS